MKHSENSLPHFGRRFDLLINTFPRSPKDSRKHSNQSLAEALAREGYYIHRSQIAKQRGDHPCNPPAALVAAICRIYDVDIRFFTDPEVGEELDMVLDSALVSGGTVERPLRSRIRPEF